MKDLSLNELAKQTRSSRKGPGYNKTRCKRCPIKLVHDGYGYRHVDETFSGDRLHGHYPEPRREASSSTTTRARTS